jgi:hypothetical protein
MRAFVKVATGGSHREMGVDFGRAAKDVLRDLAAESRGHFHAARHFRPAVRRRYPKYLEEVRGIAEGAGIAFDDIFYLTADEELVSLWERPEKCSTAVIRARDGLLLGHNEDYPPRYMDRLVVVDARPDDGPAFLALTYPYILAGPSCGLNDRGLAFGVDSLGFPARQRGVPTNYVLRDLYSARRLADVRRIVDVPGLVMGNAATVASARERDARTVEASYGGIAVIGMGKSGLLAHTNHVRSETIDRRGEKASWSSRKRLAALEHLLARPETRTRSGLAKALSSKEYGLLRHGRRANESCTVASAVLDPGRGMMYVAKRGPRGHAFKPYSLMRKENRE